MCFWNGSKMGSNRKNPFLSVEPPKHVYKKREIWTSDMIIQALEHCTDPKLAIAIHLSFACSLRLGEVLGLRWKDVAISDNDIANDDAHIFVTCELEQVSTNALKVLMIKMLSLHFHHVHLIDHIKQPLF